MYQGYHYTLESSSEDSVFPLKITTKYPLQIGMHVQIALKKRKDICLQGEGGCDVY